MNYLITFQSFFIQNHLASNLLVVAVHKEIIRVISKTRVDYTENKRVKRRKNEKQGWSQTETQDAIRNKKYTLTSLPKLQEQEHQSGEETHKMFVE